MAKEPHPSEGARGPSGVGEGDRGLDSGFEVDPLLVGEDPADLGRIVVFGPASHLSPGQQAQTFASQFLAPDRELRPDLPRRLDWQQLLIAKSKWKISLRALVFRAHRLELWSDATYVRANKQLSMEGNPERGDIGPREQPFAIGRAVDLLGEAGYSTDYLAAASRLPISALREIVAAGSEQRVSVFAPN